MSAVDLYHRLIELTSPYYVALHAFLFPSVPQVSILPFIPKSVRYTLLALLVLNCRSFPFNWHIRVWRPLFWLIFYRVRHPFATQKEVIAGWDEFSPIGANPLERVAKWSSWASLDDCDYNFHLSNSSYAKNWDSARFKDIMLDYNRLLIDGGRLAIAGTHYHYVKEIPILSSYSIKSNVICWDNKWIYYMARFTTKPPRKSKKSSQQSQSLLAGQDIQKISEIIATKEKQSESQRTASSATTTLPFGLTLPAGHDITVEGPTPNGSGTTSPSSSDSDSGNEGETPSGSGAVSPALQIDTTTSLPSQTTTFAKSPIAAGFAPIPRKLPMLDSTDGSTLNCLAISRCCWKINGRITIPPALAMACVGFGLDKETFEMVRGMRDRGEMWKFLCGGWKDVPSGERWWEKAMEGVEERRRENMRFMHQMQQGMESITML